MTRPRPTPIRFEHAADGFGIGVAEPRLSWTVPDAPDGAVATSYELELARDGVDGPGETVTVAGPDQVLVPWPFAPLASRAAGAVRVRVTGGEWISEWSEPARFETTLLDPAEWTSRFISPSAIGGIGDPAPVLHGSVTLPGGIVAARLHVTAHGLHVTSINGRRVGDEHLAPGWTSYPNRLAFRTHDVTALVAEGTNTIDVLLGNGWFRGRLGFTGLRARYGDRLAALAQLEVTHADGTVTTYGTGPDWSASPSGVLADDLYDGQITDLRLRDDAPRDTVEVVAAEPAVLSRLVAPEDPPVRTVAVVPAVAVTCSPSGKQLVDFGENVVGWVRLRVRGTSGQTVTIRHAEVLEHGELGVRPLRGAKATDTYVLAGTGEEVLEPSLTFHGFRYAEVDGIEIDVAAAEAVVISSDLRRTGEFGCSEPDVETLHANVERSMRGNFLTVPTDCPQREERLGWTGDIQVFAPTASFIGDAAGFLRAWLRDLAAEQFEDGSVPFVVPDVLHNAGPAAAAWGDAATVVPWTLYERYGDAKVLAEQYPSMRAWVDRQAALATPDGLWAGGFQFGDWLDPAAPPDDPFAAKVDADIVATAHLARSAGIVAATAEVLGKADDAREYTALAARARAAFADEYVSPAGRIVGDAPTAYAMALVWDLLSDERQRTGAGRRLADLVRAGGFRVATGFVGTPLITDALTIIGEPELAYRLLLERGCPSWLYPVSMGATTIWERWDSMLPDGTINPGEMTSFNHYALGAVADWLHRVVAGLAPAAPGYREVLVRPLPGGGLTHASARLDTPYGRTSVAWRRASGRFVLDVEVPFGASAAVHVPGIDEPQRVGPGTHHWDVAEQATPQRRLDTVRDLLDDRAAWADIVAAAAELDIADDAAVLAGKLGRYLDHPVDALPEALVIGFLPEAGEAHPRLRKIIAHHRETERA
ncbi:family 78 glycoside hydrolase catalytic domain [Pseudonocardia sp. TRM90224]|uniref:family 78 glycoside hydrolase catalytic domain n=1 Tax=Pseudonocardia sp. TRM90224 TaxID=2812678 RepID=UPI001E28B9D0|nr:family 78 glycoside hydrolase catalytic domain [Pseudonocardia sp. TRM90224]